MYRDFKTVCTTFWDGRRCRCCMTFGNRLCDNSGLLLEQKGSCAPDESAPTHLRGRVLQTLRLLLVCENCTSFNEWTRLEETNEAKNLENRSDLLLEIERERVRMREGSHPYNCWVQFLVQHSICHYSRCEAFFFIRL